MKSKLKWVVPKMIMAMLILTLQIGCARSDRAIFDQSQSLINQRKYAEAIELLEKEIPKHPTVELKSQLGYAYLGRAGIELLEIAKNITFLKSFKSIDVNADSMFGKCAELSTEVTRTTHVKCLPLLRISGFPDPENPFLLKAISIFNTTFPDPANTNQEINFLLAIVHLGVATSNYNKLVTVPEDLIAPKTESNRELQLAATTYALKYFKRTTDSFFAGVQRLYFSYGKIKRFLAQYDGKPVFTMGTYTYYISSRFSFEDFFQFLLTSADQEVRHQATTAIDQKETVEVFSNKLFSVMYDLNLTIIDGEQNFLAKLFIRALSLSQFVVPKKVQISSLGIIDVRNLLTREYPMPKTLQRMVDSVKDSWQKENTVAIFNMVDYIRHQELELKLLESDWLNFWESLDDPTQASLKEKAAVYRDRIPVVIIDPNKGPDMMALREWYSVASKELELWADDVNITSSEQPQLRKMSSLLERTENWISNNLW